MPVELLNDAGDIDMGIAPHTVDNNTFEQGVFPRLLHTGATYAFPSSEVESEDQGETGGPTGRRRVAKGGDMDLPMHFRYDANKIPEAAAFRETGWTAEFSYTGAGAAGDLQIVLAGTHEDLTTGLQIKAPLGALATLGGSAARGLLVLNEGWTDPVNNQPWAVKAVHDDGVNDLVDIFAGYGGGGALDPMGAPKVAVDSETATLHFGEYIKNRKSCLSTPFSVMVDRFCLTEERRFRGLLGWVANDYTLEIPDEGAVMCTVTGVGRRWLQSQATPPNGEAIPDHFSDPTLRDFVVGGEDLEFLALVTYPNAASPTAVPILLADKNVQSFTFNLTGGVEGKTNILGMTGVLPKTGRYGMSGSLSAYVANDAVMKQLEDLGSSDFHQKAAIHTVFKDPDGNWKGLSLPRNEFAQTGGEGGTGDETFTLEYGSEAIDNLFRAAILQQWAAF